MQRQKQYSARQCKNRAVQITWLGPYHTSKQVLAGRKATCKARTSWRRQQSREMVYSYNFLTASLQREAPSLWERTGTFVKPYPTRESRVHLRLDNRATCNVVNRCMYVWFRATHRNTDCSGFVIHWTNTFFASRSATNSHWISKFRVILW
jgi:predicted choloylglycine hydrolase